MRCSSFSFCLGVLKQNAHVFRNKSAGISQEKKYSPDVGRIELNESLADSYKVYGVDWNPHTITWYVNGFPFAQIENTYWHQPLFLKFDIETNEAWQGVIPDMSEMGTKTFSVDFVRVFKYEKKPKVEAKPPRTSTPPVVVAEAPSGLKGWSSPHAPKLARRWINSPRREKAKYPSSDCSNQAA